MTMNKIEVKEYNAHNAHFVTIDDGMRETTILRESGETVKECIARHITDQKQLCRRVNDTLAFYGEALQGL